MEGGRARSGAGGRVGAPTGEDDLGEMECGERGSRVGDVARAGSFGMSGSGGGILSAAGAVSAGEVGRALGPSHRFGNASEKAWLLSLRRWSEMKMRRRPMIVYRIPTGKMESRCADVSFGFALRAFLPV